MRVLNTDIRATTDEQGIAELRFAENINELILVSLESEEYIESTQTCFAKQYQDRNNPYTILTQLANFAIINLTMYQEQIQDNTTKQIPIYTAQPYITNNQAQSNNTPISSNTQTHTNTTDSQNLISLQAHIQTLQGGKMSAIQWGYYIKDRNENLKSKITIKDLKSFAFTSNDMYNTQVSFDIKAKFTYTITENNTQKEIIDYLKDNQQLVIFAYKNNPAYNVGEKITHTILTISTLPIITIGHNTLTLWHNDIKEIFHIDNTILSHLLKDYTENTQYKLGYNIQNDYLALRLNSKLYKIHKNNPNNTQSPQDSSNNTQQDNTDSIYLKESKDFENLKNTLQLTSQQIYQEVKVYVEINNLRLSGKEWVKEYKDKASIEDLSSPFKENVKDFLKAIDEAKKKTPKAKITYHISSTRRPYKRAVLMHYCHKVAHNKISPQQAQIETQKENIPINWIHTDSSGKYSEKISRAKALEMVRAYGIAYPASLTSHHVRGNAIDITITWQSSFTIKDKAGKEHTIDTPKNGAINLELRKVGETYGVKRTLEKDPPHWSLEGN